MLLTDMVVREYVAANGTSPFRRWFDRLDALAAAKVTVATIRLEAGNTSNVKSLGGGLSEIRIDWGPGYRIYFGQEGEALVMLFGGGTKARQQRDIEAARLLLAESRDRNMSAKRPRA